jgi:Raf kinase inhibitor-like YbhB/YbcL family protein
MKIEVPAYEYGAPIPARYAFGIPDAEGHVTYGPNVNPLIRWSDVPDGTRSFALLMVDVCVPSRGDDVNKEGRTVPADLPRVDFYHFVLADIPANLRELPEGADSRSVTEKGKPLGETPYGVRGINDYTGWFAGDPDMAGNYGGYDGPCPPWNDTVVHNYYLTIYALDTATLGLAGAFGGEDVLKTMEGHVLGKATHMGTYKINPEAR